MRFQPKTEREIAEDGLLQPGVYDCEVIGAEEATSQAGNDMLKVRLRIFADDGSERVLTDYLMEKVAYKLRHAAEVFGLMASYEKGQLHADDFVGRAGKVKIAIRKDKNGQYPDQNSVADYVMAASTAGAARAASSQGGGRTQGGGGRSQGGGGWKPPPDLDDAIPF